MTWVTIVYAIFLFRVFSPWKWSCPLSLHLGWCWKVALYSVVCNGPRVHVACLCGAFISAVNCALSPTLNFFISFRAGSCVTFPEQALFLLDLYGEFVKTAIICHSGGCHCSDHAQSILVPEPVLPSVWYYRIVLHTKPGPQPWLWQMTAILTGSL